MGTTTAIDWTHFPNFIGGTWNPWQGCTKISDGCKNCYMYREKVHFGQDPKVVIRSAKDTFRLPARIKDPHCWFVCSWSDFCHEAVKGEWLDEAWNIMEANPQHLYLICTKRIEQLPDCLPANWGEGWPNVFLGVTVESRKYLGRVQKLLEIPAKHRFISNEPTLGFVDFSSCIEGIDWLIDGGESGPGYRPAEAAWFLWNRDVCRFYGKAYFHKQNGGDKKIEKKWGGDLLDGKQYHEFPDIG